MRSVTNDNSAQNEFQKVQKHLKIMLLIFFLKYPIIVSVLLSLDNVEIVLKILDEQNSFTSCIIMEIMNNNWTAII